VIVFNHVVKEKGKPKPCPSSPFQIVKISLKMFIREVMLLQVCQSILVIKDFLSLGLIVKNKNAKDVP
jgi:hypothetical protein